MTSLRCPILRCPIYWVDAFTQQPFRGNAAVVVPDATGLTVEQMQLLAREVNCSETAFFTPASQAGADWHLRWFTPSQEIDFCGHATVAAVHILCQRQPEWIERGQLLLQTRIGLVPIALEPDPQNLGPQKTASVQIWLTVPPCTWRPQPQTQSQLCATLGISAQRPVPVLDSLNQDLLVAADSLEQLQQLQPDLAKLGELGQAQGWRGICVYSTTTLEPENHLHVRFFAPHCGIPEDPVTGSVSVPLTSYLAQQGKLTENFITVEQGDVLGRAGRVRVDLAQSRFGGQAITLMAGELHLPNHP